MATWVSWYQTVMQTVLGFPAAEHDGISGSDDNETTNRCKAAVSVPYEN